MSRARSKARRGALQALYQWQLSGGADSLASIETQFLAERELRDVDTEYFHELLTEVSRRHAEFDQRIAPLLDRPSHSWTRSSTPFCGSAVTSWNHAGTFRSGW